MSIQIHPDEREPKFQKLKELANELFIPVPEVFYTIKIQNPGAEEKIIKSRSHTWVRNFYNVLFAMVSNVSSAAGSYGAGYIVSQSTSGGNITSGFYNVFYDLIYPGATSYGIVVGSSATAYSFEHIALQTRIAHGTGSGQLSHVDMTEQTPVYTSGTKTWNQIIRRQFNNNSGASIDVNEIGMYFYNTLASIMLCRDVLSSTVAVANSGQLTVEYETQLTFPA
jgi:hypothetical protein